MKYFNVKGYFLANEYVANMGIDLDQRTAGSSQLSEGDFADLKRAIELSDSKSDEGNIAGVIGLIQLVEGLQDSYGISHDHTHPTEAILDSVKENPDIVRQYRLERLLTRQPETKVETKTRTRTR